MRYAFHRAQRLLPQRTRTAAGDAPRHTASCRTGRSVVVSLVLTGVAVTGLMMTSATMVCAATVGLFRPDEQDSPEAPLKIQIDDVTLNNMGGLSSISGMFVMELTVTNQSDEPLDLENDQFRFLCDDVDRPCSTAVRSPLLARPRTLQPGETLSGAIGSNITKFTGTEPPMVLRWSDGTHIVDASVNTAFQRIFNLQTTRVGPDDCLAVVSVEKHIGILASWILTREFQRLKDDGLKRVVLHIKSDPQNSMSYSHRMAVYGWLGSIKVGYEQRRFGFNQNVSSKVQFPDFQVVGMGTRDPYGYSSASTRNIYRSSLDEAIAYCLRSLYVRADLSSALKDMHHPEQGVRRVALETNIDRLSAAQLESLLHPAHEMSPAQQALLAANLHRVAFPVGVQSLREFAASEHPEVVRAAIDALVQSASPLAVDCLREVWEENHAADLRIHIVNSVLNAQDFRQASLIEEYAHELLAASQARPPADAPESTDTPPQKPTPPITPPTRMVQPGGTAAVKPVTVSLRRVLSYLQNQDRTGIRDAARRAVPRILKPDVQDSIVDFLVRTTTEQDEQLAQVVRNYVSQRLSIVDPPADPESDTDTGKRQLTDAEKLKLQERFGMRSTTRDPRISTTLFNVIKKFPDSQYTPSLLKLAESSLISNSLKRTAYQVATQCASDTQLDDMIRRYSKLDRYSKDYLLRQLGSINHPQWLRLAKQSLRTSESEQRLAISVLSQHGSIEAMELIAEQLATVAAQVNAQATSRKYLNTYTPQEKQEHQLAAFAESIAMKPTDARTAESLVNNLRAATLPVVRRAINRCERSHSEQLNQIVERANLDQLRQDLNSPLLRSALQHRADNDNQTASQELDKYLAVDPFNVSVLISRASLHLRMDEPQLAKQKLDEALRLSPENADVESLLALTQIRLGNIDGGIQQMRNILETIPNLNTTVRRDAEYNLACVYGRAVEQTTDSAKRERLTRLGIEAMRSSIHRPGGFDSVEHVKNDPDLNVFRGHPDWPAILKVIAENEGDD